MADQLIELGPGVSISLEGLLGDKLLLVGNSNSGKSRLIRRICEQVGTRLPIFVFDLEGEFATLREKLPIVLAGDDGEVDVSVETAAKLARRLVELGVSAVLNLQGMTKKDKRGFVREFLQSMIDLPRKLWGPRLVFLDEIHEYCPQTGAEADARETVNRFMALVRKRGSGVIGATQRMAKLDKDSAAEFNNVCIGRCTLDVDLKRAGERIYFTKERWSEIRSLKPGQFYAVGPSFQHEDVKLFRGGEISTHHPSPGERRKLVPPPPSKAILKFADELKDLKKEVADEKSEIETLRAENKRLRSSRPITPSNGVAKIDERALAAARTTGYAEGMSVLGGVIVESFDQFERDLASIEAGLKSLGVDAASMRASLRDGRKATTKGARVAPSKPLAPKSRTAWASAPSERNTDGSVGNVEAFERDIDENRRIRQKGTANPAVGSGGMQRILMVLAQHPDGLEPNAIGLLARMSAKGGTFSTYMGRLRTHGWVEKDGSRFVATAVGVEALGGVEPLPTGDELREYWLDWSGDGGQRRLLAAVLDAGDDGITKDDAAAEAQLAGNAGTFSTYLGRLRTANLVESFKRNGVLCLRATGMLR
jgi:hypothetical protein